MKKILVLISFFLPFLSFAFTVPEKPTSFVNDYAGVLTSEQKTELENKIQTFEQASTNEIAVVIIKSLEGDTIENVAQDIFTKWGIGKKDKNNGVLVLVFMDERRTRIHTGYGLEGDLTDIGTSYIQSEVMTPAFREGDYYSGINGAVDKIIESLTGANIIPEDYVPPQNIAKFKYQWQLIAFAIFVLQWIFAILARSKSWWAGGIFGGVAGLAIWKIFLLSLLFAVPTIIILILIGLGFDYLVSKSYEKHKNSGTNTPWFFGGGGGGFSGGGGFGGFGGGFSGGGGSSGRW